jgi:hypothetical protein
VSALQVHKWLKGNEIWALVMLESVVDKKNLEHKDEIQTLLLELVELFEVPQQLPPSRQYDHYICYDRPPL